MTIRYCLIVLKVPLNPNRSFKGFFSFLKTIQRLFWNSRPF